MSQYGLRDYSEPCPAWLSDLSPGIRRFPLAQMLGSRVLFYPGAGCDSYPLKIFSETQAAHCFVFADYCSANDWKCNMKQAGFRSDPGAVDLERRLSAKFTVLGQYEAHGLAYLMTVNGYRPVSVGQLKPEDIFMSGFLNLKSRYPDINDFFEPDFRWGIWSVMEKSGPKDRLRFCYLACEAVSAYMSIWPERNMRKATLRGPEADSNGPYAVVIKDHSFGCNWKGNHWGGEKSVLYKYSKAAGLMPEWLLAGSRPWPGYSKSPEAAPRDAASDLFCQGLYKKIG